MFHKDKTYVVGGRFTEPTAPRLPIAKEFFYDKPSAVVDFDRCPRDKTMGWQTLLTYCTLVSEKSGKKVFPDFIEHSDKDETVTTLTLPAHCGYNAIHADTRHSCGSTYIEELVRASVDIVGQLAFIHMTAAFLYDIKPVYLGPLHVGRAEEVEPIGCRSCVASVHCHTHSGGRSLVGPMLVESDP